MQVIERILHMLRVKDCRHVCLFCEYYDMCKQETEQQKRGSEAAKGRERFDRNGKVYRRGKEQGEIGETVELLTGIERPRHQGGSFKETDSKSRRI